jgi:CRP-like cAMP-binding protein
MITIEMLKGADLFCDLSDQTLETIVGLAISKTFEEGDNVYQLGDDANDLYLMDTGRIRFSLGVGNRPESSGSFITPGSVFGWAALLKEQPRRVATASCLEDSALFVIPGDKLLEVFHNDKDAGYLVMRRLATMIARDFMSVLSV